MQKKSEKGEESIEILNKKIELDIPGSNLDKY